MGKVLVKPGWLAIYGKEAAGRRAARTATKGQNLVPEAGRKLSTRWPWTRKGLKTKPARPLH